jgi:microcystin-dependent protein
MPDTYTENLQLVLPEVGASRDSWGAKLSSNFSVLDEFVSMSMPLGSLLDYAGPTPPPGWLIADGRAVSRTTYSELFQVLATYWGPGDGSTTFNLPNFGGRVSVGAGALTDENGTPGNYIFSSRLGVQLRQVVQANLPSINLTATSAGSHSHAGATAAGGTHNHITDTQGVHWHGGGATGAGGSHQHGGGTDLQGNHNHTVGLWNLGTGAAGGSIGVVSDIFGGASYTTSVNGAHTHAIITDIASAHTHSIATDGGHAHTTTTIGDHAHAIGADGNHTHTVALGGGNQGLDIRQPLAVVTKIIYAGGQAAAAATTTAVPLVRRLMSAPMRGTH